MLTEREKLIWLACFVDTDGCISIYDSSYVKDKKYAQYVTTIFTNNSLELLETVTEYLTYFNISSAHNFEGKSKEVAVRNKYEVVKLLELLEPFVILNKEKLQRGLELVRQSIAHEKFANDFRELSPAERGKLWDELPASLYLNTPKV